ncbi:PREDICTED: uncharacterized protein LOC109475213 [Branchiostoma belcheri]|uniref:Uncharacterized protein LOC109475213 n=1 Tax=Branchiostoma belcheri TaxID=7741 RepID=A0A6P4YPG0_BRABE|nr:PREDICTED: uncharacterized protein LOC109475213 [Branchiostoma belcheri]
MEKENKLKLGNLSLLANILEKIGRHDYAELARQVAADEQKVLSTKSGSSPKKGTKSQKPPCSSVEDTPDESIKAPDGLNVIENKNDSVKLGWTKVSSNQINGYRLEQSFAFEDKWISAQGRRKMLPATITEFTVVNLAPYEEYHFCIRSALDRRGELVLSERSVPLYVVTREQNQPYPPRMIRVADRTQVSLSLTWKEPVPAPDVNPASYEYVVEMCIHGKDRTLNTWTEYCRTTQRKCTINVQHNGDYRFRVLTNNKEHKISSLPEEMGDPGISIHVEARSGGLIQFLKARWPFFTNPTKEEAGSIVFIISCHDLDGLRELWMNYKLGKVNRFLDDLFARQARLSSVETDTDLEIKIDKGDFYACRQHLLLTSPIDNGYRMVRLGGPNFEASTAGKQQGLSEDFPVYCKPIAHKATCSQLDFLDPAVPMDQLVQIQATHKSMSVAIEDLLDAEHTARGQDYGRKQKQWKTNQERGKRKGKKADPGAETDPEMKTKKETVLSTKSGSSPKKGTKSQKPSCSSVEDTPDGE